MVSDFDVVTGAFSYSGKAIADALLASGRRVRTLTGHPGRAPASSPIEARPLDFGDPAGLEASLAGAGTLYNTYWVRFAHGDADHDRAVANSRALITAAAKAQVGRVVHISIMHPSESSPFPYFRGKAQVERALADSGLPHSVLRPSVLFGGDGVLINNIAWLLRRLPVFLVGGTGEYRLRPVHVEDLARACLEQAAETEDRVMDAAGPDRPSFLELVVWIRDAIGAKSAIYRAPGDAVVLASRALGYFLHDVLLTRDEYLSMAQGMADSDEPPLGTTKLSDWLVDQSSGLGLRYANELERHFKR
ncbi:MAG TPA: NAD(P)H-binding protein [Acidimicrobiales bacterium]|nr:NAD(P)H-binding protein [Acidimicrobiales bacterium]